MFTGGWTEESLQAASLLQRAQTGVAAGCTGLCQPGKGSLGSLSRGPQSKMREKARQQGVRCTYRTFMKDILQAVRAMHDQMVSQNEKEKTVLRAMRQGGWFHWRPDREGKLQPVSEQPGRRQCKAEQQPSCRQKLLGGGWPSEAI